METPPETFLETLGTQKNQWLAVYRYFKTRGDKDHLLAWLLSSSCKDSGQWLNWKGGLDVLGELTASEFMENIRLRLLIDPFLFMDDVTCPQWRNISLKDSPLHALDCN